MIDKLVVAEMVLVPLALFRTEVPVPVKVSADVLLTLRELPAAVLVIAPLFVNVLLLTAKVNKPFDETVVLFSTDVPALLDVEVTTGAFKLIVPEPP